MARGYPGAFGRKVNSPLGLDPADGRCSWCRSSTPRRPLRLLHLDLAVLAAFGISVAYFNDAQIDVSVPLAYPLLATAGAHALDRPAHAARATARRAARGCTCSSPPPGWPSRSSSCRLPHRPERHELERHRRRLRGRHRRRQARRRRAALRRLPDRQRARRHLRPGRPTPPTCRSSRCWAGAARGTTCRPRTARRSSSTCCACCCCSCSAAALRGPGLGVVARLRLGGLPVHALRDGLQRQRRAGRRARAGGAATSRPAPRRAARSPRWAAWRSSRTLALAPLFATHGRERGCVARTSLFSRRLRDRRARRAERRSSSRASRCARCYDRTIGFQADRGSPFSIWGLYGLATLQHVWQAAAPGARRRARLPAAPRDVVGLGALRRRGRHRAAARRHPLVLPVHRVVLPARARRLLARYAEPIDGPEPPGTAPEDDVPSYAV